MKTLLLLLLFLNTGSLRASEPEELSPFLETSSTFSDGTASEKIRSLFHKISETTFYCGTGSALGMVSLLTRVAVGINFASPKPSAARNECLLLSELCGSAAHHFFTKIFHESPETPFFKGVPPSQQSWYLNQAHLSHVPAFSPEEKELLHFLEKRWLAKTTGFFPMVVEWVCPCFGVSVQVHPETNNCYARSPWIKITSSYQNRVDAWKQSLPHPRYFPLVLTRPYDVLDYLPSYFAIPEHEEMQMTMERLASKMQSTDAKIVVDVTCIVQSDTKDRKKWLQVWKAYQASFYQACKQRNIDLNRVLCIEKVQQEGLGGLRLLPLDSQSPKEVELHYQTLLERVSTFGLSANRIELDRSPLSDFPIGQRITPRIPIEYPTKKDFLSHLSNFEQAGRTGHPQKDLMLLATLQTLKGLFANVSREKWNEILHCPTRSALVQLSLLKIIEQFDLLADKDFALPFFDTMSHVEQIHAHISALLEIFSPYTFSDFPRIYRSILAHTPAKLKPLTYYGIHTSAMSSLAGIFNSVAKTAGKIPCVLYGENTYFECIKAAQIATHADSIDKATEENWKDVDLILGQFNPVLKRIELPPTEYKMEKISETLKKALNGRAGRPLTLALDTTLDFIDSHRVGLLLAEFEKEIESGALNVICYRSGHKFDLFGMDNYCGAPFYMIHNQDAKWAFFDSLWTDPTLQTDRLSLNWFCLAYQNAAPQLEQYQKQVFDNTRTLLSKVPSRLLNNKNVTYRIVPVELGLDPSFIDIKISGPFHKIRAASLVGGSLYLKCMEARQPIFYRLSLGFYHTNFTMLFSDHYSTIRLTLGLDPAQVDVLAQCLTTIDSLNGP